MPATYRGSALPEVQSILREIGYGYRGTAGSRATDDAMARIAGWGTSDMQYVAGTRDTPGNMTIGRIRLAEMLRGLVTQRRGEYYLSFWWGTAPTDVEDATVHHLGNLRDGLGGEFNDLYFTITRDGHISVASHWQTVMSAYGPGADLSQAERDALNAELPAGIAFFPTDQPTTGQTNEYLGYITPTQELLDSMPVRARAYAQASILRRRGNENLNVYWEVNGSTYTLKYRQGNAGLQAVIALGLTGEQMVATARESYRIWLRMQWRRPTDNGEAARIQKMEEHRRQSKTRFDAFRAAKPVMEVEVIPTLPFLPHGLASSRRWGIEIESGGARGIQPPPGGWERKGDGSLRSAWAGYREVQDFEPYDREETIDISWYDCENYNQHMPHEQYYDEERREYAYRVNASYIPITDCENCGQRTRTVRVEPQTIVHEAQRDDCAEFVSPILVSMHSNGLETLLAQIALQPQNDSAGVHVHVEANDLTDKQIATLIYGYDMLEPMIEKSYRRNRRDFCARREAQDVLAAARSVKHGTPATVRGGNRYVTVNTNSLSRHGTIEFRAMGPVYDYNHLIRWAMFCREMVNSVAAGATQKDFGRAKKWEDVLSIFTRFGKEFVRAAIYEMTGETGEAARLSKEGNAITTEAVNADLQATLTNFAAVAASAQTASENIRGLSNAFGNLTFDEAVIARLAERLTVSDRTLVTI